MSDKKQFRQEEDSEVLVRIAGQDIKGSKKIFVGLTKVKGVSWSIANILCKTMKIDKNKRIGELSKDEVENIEKELKTLKVPKYLKNRPIDPATGEDKHLLSVELDMAKEFDIKRMKQIKSYKGNRHTFKLPVRGQRTRSNFRKSGVAMGVKKAKVGKKG